MDWENDMNSHEAKCPLIANHSSNVSMSKPQNIIATYVSPPVGQAIIEVTV
jgi:hypothetical protein